MMEIRIYHSVIAKEIFPVSHHVYRKCQPVMVFIDPFIDIKNLLQFQSENNLHLHSFSSQTRKVKQQQLLDSLKSCKALLTSYTIAVIGKDANMITVYALIIML